MKTDYIPDEREIYNFIEGLDTSPENDLTLRSVKTTGNIDIDNILIIVHKLFKQSIKEKIDSVKEELINYSDKNNLSLQDIADVLKISFHDLNEILINGYSENDEINSKLQNMFSKNKIVNEKNELEMLDFDKINDELWLKFEKSHVD